LAVYVDWKIFPFPVPVGAGRDPIGSPKSKRIKLHTREVPCLKQERIGKPPVGASAFVSLDRIGSDQVGANTTNSAPLDSTVRDTDPSDTAPSAADAGSTQSIPPVAANRFGCKSRCRDAEPKH